MATGEPGHHSTHAQPAVELDRKQDLVTVATHHHPLVDWIACWEPGMDFSEENKNPNKKTALTDHVQVEWLH